MTGRIDKLLNRVAAIATITTSTSSLLKIGVASGVLAMASDTALSLPILDGTLAPFGLGLFALGSCTLGFRSALTAASERQYDGEDSLVAVFDLPRNFYSQGTSVSADEFRLLYLSKKHRSFYGISMPKSDQLTLQDVRSTILSKAIIPSGKNFDEFRKEKSVEFDSAIAPHRIGDERVTFAKFQVLTQDRNGELKPCWCWLTYSVCKNPMLGTRLIIRTYLPRQIRNFLPEDHAAPGFISDDRLRAMSRSA